MAVFALAFGSEDGEHVMVRAIVRKSFSDVLLLQMQCFDALHV
jgi:hypothetical protein